MTITNLQGVSMRCTYLQNTVTGMVIDFKEGTQYSKKKIYLSFLVRDEQRSFL